MWEKISAFSWSVHLFPVTYRNSVDDNCTKVRILESVNLELSIYSVQIVCCLVGK